MPFRDRQDAGNRLAERLDAYRGRDVIVFALPRGGVEVALPIAHRLQAPLELLLVRKIGVPGYSEVAMGAIVDGDGPITVRNEDVLALEHISDAAFEAAARRELAEIERRRSLYLSGRQPLAPEGHIAIVVDDGVATGATLRAALQGLKQKKPSRIVVAMPVGPEDFIEELRREVDDVICLEPLGSFSAVGAHYDRFDQLSDADVIDLMQAARHSVPHQREFK